MTPGKDTSEYKLSWRSIVTIVATTLSAILASGMLPESSLASKAIAGLVAVAAALGIGKVASSYTASRAQVKTAEAAKQIADAAPKD